MIASPSFYQLKIKEKSKHVSFTTSQPRKKCIFKLETKKSVNLLYIPKVLIVLCFVHCKISLKEGNNSTNVSSSENIFGKYLKSFEETLTELGVSHSRGVIADTI